MFDASLSSVQLRLSELLQWHPFLILDGAMGTELEHRGYRTTLPLWSAKANLDAPQLIGQIHRDYIAAGANIITANTFRTTWYTFTKSHNSTAAVGATERAVTLAREAIDESGSDILLAGSLAPLEDCYSPELVPPPDIVRNAYAEQISMLFEAGVDFVLAETMINHSEITEACAFCSAHGLPFMMSFTVEDQCLLDGTPFDDIIEEVSKHHPLALLVNCRSTEKITGALQQLVMQYPGLKGAYGNGPGHPDAVVGWHFEEGGVGQYCTSAEHWYEMGARIIGGCCGTTPGHIHAVYRMREQILQAS